MADNSFNADWGHEKNQDGGKEEDKKSPLKVLNIKLPGGTDFIPANSNVVEYEYSDSLGGPLMIICDECAELLTRNGGKDSESKEEDQKKNEIENIIKSLTQLGRSSCIHLVLATQRNDANIIPGMVQNNCLDSNTYILKEC